MKARVVCTHSHHAKGSGYGVANGDAEEVGVLDESTQLDL